MRSTILIVAALLALTIAAPPASATNSVCTPGTFAFINPMPRACASWSLYAVCISARVESTTTECVPLP